MKYLNLGCGSHYSKETVWTNLDFVSTGETVIAHNLLDGIPFVDESFDLVYHSHVLEHFSKEDGEKLISECFRVLKPGGVLRIVIPNLETIAKNYLYFLNEGMNHPGDETIKANYEWTLMEMYDQTVRNQMGGNMIKYLQQEKILNEDFVLKRIGGEGIAIREAFLNPTIPNPPSPLIKYLRNIKGMLKNNLNKFLDPYLKPYQIGTFRQGGEIHQWMYDRYSLTNLLKNKGGKEIEIRDAFSSYITDWATYEIDGKYPVIRKLDSLFIEARK
jgi:predicted SAM-dependent methyltransferase